MPNIRNVRDLRKYASNGTFMSAQDPKYAVANHFNRKLLDLQDKLKNTNERELSEKVSRFAKDLMTLQMHDSPMTREEDLDTAITDVTIDLPYYLKTPGKGEDEKTGYQQIVQPGKPAPEIQKESDAEVKQAGEIRQEGPIISGP